MDVFDLRDRVIGDYGAYVRSFIEIRDQRVERLVASTLEAGLLWPEPLVQLNPAFEPGEPLDALVAAGVLHPECLRVFRHKEAAGVDEGPLRLHRHQVDAIRAARAGDHYVLTTGTGSGKSLAYIVPIVEHVLRRGSGRGIQAIIVYPMNALANSQKGELEKFLNLGYPVGHPPVTFARYTGQEDLAERNRIIADPPDILLTNYVMLELLLTRPDERQLIEGARGLRFLVLDELHTYRGRQGSDVALLVRRTREACRAQDVLMVGTSATLAGGGSWREQQGEVARVATKLFGVDVRPERVIGETLRRTTMEHEEDDPTFVEALVEQVVGQAGGDVADGRAFLERPLTRWIESTLGLRRDAEGRLTRQTPLALRGADSAVDRLVRLSGLDPDLCEAALRRALLEGYRSRDAFGFPVFAFRLHQFVSKGESVYASPEPADRRYLTLQAQRFVPDSERSRVLLPLAFCRECGQDYYVVRRTTDEDGGVRYEPRELSDRLANDDGDPGFLYLNDEAPWPAPEDDLTDRLPESWIELRDGRPVVRDARRKKLPRELFLSPLGVEGAGAIRAHWLLAPFQFCLWCRVAYDARQASDFGKLATLGSEGRSTATTVLALATVRKLRQDGTLPPKARKLLSFTDNRQDASLQAGHFNDFVEVVLLRSALWRAVKSAGPGGLRHEELPLRVFEALDLSLAHYAQNPKVEYFQLEETQRALRAALGYYLYRDLRRGWRVTSPNLEQCGLLDIGYASLDAFCADEPKWSGVHEALARATPAERRLVCQTLLDFMRRELAIRVDFLDPVQQEGMRQLSSQYLVAPWSLDELDRLEASRIVFPRSRGMADADDDVDAGPSPRAATKSERPNERNVYLSELGGFGQFLKRRTTFPTHPRPLETKDSREMIRQLLELLAAPGFLRRVVEPAGVHDAPGYQLNAAAIQWRHGDGTRAFHDPIRVPNAPTGGLRPNRFFVDFYRSDTGDLRRLEAHEHTAQVPADKRREREDNFGEARLPVLFCSPTMELGVDIKQLNAVNLRNVPPTPANYAQRSGRAGRSGQPAFVFSYCSAGSPHDQYFFKRPQLMVAGAVKTPRLDLANEDLLRAHVHAVWLSESKLKLGRSLVDVLVAEGDEPSLELRPAVRDVLRDASLRDRAMRRVLHALREAIEHEFFGLDEAEAWVARVLDELPRSFDEACERWRGLYRGALGQSKRQSRLILDASRDPKDRDRARGLRDEAEAQLRLLMETSEEQHSDFYSYRYFASEGFLPGYSFPRLPLSAYLPGRRNRRGDTDFLSRPRFLAISEFGPRAIIYHEGSRYVVNKVILPVGGEDGGLTRRAAQCETCGYLHPLGDEPAPDLCERCKSALPSPYKNLFRMQNVASRRRDRINSDEEERVRLGYEVKTGVRFATRAGAVSATEARLVGGGDETLARLVYGHAATLWRINMGWRRRTNKAEKGYVLDTERGFWSKSQEITDDPDDPMSSRTTRVIPYVEDRRNCVLLTLGLPLPVETMATLQAALKAALQVHYQLEDNELAAEPLPDEANRQHLLLYEAAEGGAGVLRNLVEDPEALADVARRALEIAHMNPETGADVEPSPGRPRCEAACYDCLLSYYNQRDHRLLDRTLVRDLLLAWTRGEVKTSPVAARREDHVDHLTRLCQSELERHWLRAVEATGLRLPSDAQALIDEARVKPDFLYRSEGIAVFIDGPVHDGPDQRTADRAAQDRLEDEGYTVIRFHHAADWDAIFDRWPSAFGPRPHAGAELPENRSPQAELDLDCFSVEWREVVQALRAAGFDIEPGADVVDGDRVVGQTLARVGLGARFVTLVDEADEEAEAVLAALRARGAPVLGVAVTDVGLVERVRAGIIAGSEGG